MIRVDVIRRPEEQQPFFSLSEKHILNAVDGRHSGVNRAVTPLMSVAVRATHAVCISHKTNEYHPRVLAVF